MHQSAVPRGNLTQKGKSAMSRYGEKSGSGLGLRGEGPLENLGLKIMQKKLPTNINLDHFRRSLMLTAMKKMTPSKEPMAKPRTQF